MFSAFERMLALRYLRARREEGFLSLFTVFSVIGIVLGVATLVVVTAVMDGFKNELLDRVVRINGEISIQSETGEIRQGAQLAARLAATEGVRYAIPSYAGKALLTKDSASSVAIVTGIKPGGLAKKKVITESLVSGNFAGFGAQKMMLGSRLAEKLGVGVGDGVTFISAGGLSTGGLNTVSGGTGETRIGVFTVAAVFDVGLYEYDASNVFIPLDDAQAYFESAAPSQIEIAGDGTLDPARLYQRVWDLLPGGLRVTDWRANSAGFVNMVNTQRNVLFLVLSLIVLVAAINIISGQIMLVNSKTRDIAILRTMGATRKNVLKIFFMIGAFIGALGTLTGVLSGWLFAANIDFLRLKLEALTGIPLFDPKVRGLAKMPADIEVSTLIWVMLMAFGLTMLASLYPAWKAARQSPLEGIRNA